jgi:hypothetical protein
MEAEEDLVTMLYYLGFLTIKENQGGQSILKMPNRTVESLYSKLYLGYMNKTLALNTADLNRAVTDMLNNGSVVQFGEFLHKCLALLSDYDFAYMNEQGIKNFVVAFLRMYQNINLETELVVANGRIDLAVFPTLLYTFKHYYIFELKYLSKANYGKKDTGEAAYNAIRAKAIKQLNQYRTSEIVTDVEKVARVHKIVMVAIKDDVRIEEIP